MKKTLSEKALLNLIKKELRFEIGEQFELNEFNVKTLKSVSINDIEYDVYQYIKGDIREVFNLKITKILLYYNADILSAVHYCFNSNDLKSLMKNISQLLKQDENTVKFLKTATYKTPDGNHLIMKIKDNLKLIYKAIEVF